MFQLFFKRLLLNVKIGISVRKLHRGYDQEEDPIWSLLYIPITVRDVKCFTEVGQR